jgi:hypothetical protein
LLAAVFVASALVVLGNIAHAASFAVDEGAVARRDPRTGTIRTTIRITGAIEEGDADRLRAILTRIAGTGPSDKRGGRIVAELSSNGGDVYAGLNMGYLFKEFDVATVVRTRDICLSACALAFLGGTASHVPPSHVPDRSIDIGGEVGFHNFVINPNSASLSSATDARSGLVVGFSLARGGASLLMRYASAMALDPGFIARLLGRPAEVFEYIDSDGEFVDLASCANGVERPRIPPAEVATNICNHATGDFSTVEASQAHEMTAAQLKRHLLEHVQENSEQAGLQGVALQQVSTALAARGDKQVEAVYDDLRQLGVVLPQIVGPAFEITGYSSGSYKMQCHVSYSLEDPDRYDLVIQGPSGLTKAFKTAPRQCGRLFLFDRADILNPQKK